MTVDELNTIAWADFIQWAWSEPEMRAQFTAKTGVVIVEATNPIERIIDDATGASRGVVSEFIEWATINHWGVEHAPAAYRKTLGAKR